MDRDVIKNYMKETPLMARNRSLHERLMAFAPAHHHPAYIATTVERDENGAYLKIPLVSPLAAAYKHQACKYCGSFEVGSSHLPCRFPSFTLGYICTNSCTNHTFPPQCPPKKMCNEERDFWLVDSKKWPNQKLSCAYPKQLWSCHLLAYQSRW